jgi:D-inositol-3-phosphate glycosyltransferase
VFTRAWDPAQPAIVAVEPGFRVHHVAAGPLAPVPKEKLPGVVSEFTEGVADRLAALSSAGHVVDALHANYWLSGVSGHTLKHDLGVPLLSTFHTLDRVKADVTPEELVGVNGLPREVAEAEVIGCSDAVLASCTVEAEQLVELYDADPSRIQIVAPGVDRAFFSPGEYTQARRAIGYPAEAPLLLFVGRIQPLKGLDMAVGGLAEVVHGPERGQMYRRGGSGRRLADASLIVIGGPSGPHGDDELAHVRRRIRDLDLTDRVRFIPPRGHEMLSTFYRAADVVVVPSRSESFGLVALEAAACGIPVVASAVGGLTTLVDHGRTGYLVDERDPATFGRRIASVLGDPGLAASMGHAASHRSAPYTWTVAAARLRALYRELTSRTLVECR